MKPKRRIYRVTYKCGLWVCNRTGTPKGDGPVCRTKTKREAVKIACKVARRYPPSQVVIHLRNGRIETEHTYGADPRRRKG